MKTLKCICVLAILLVVNLGGCTSNAERAIDISPAYWEGIGQGIWPSAVEPVEMTAEYINGVHTARAWYFLWAFGFFILGFKLVDEHRRVVGTFFAPLGFFFGLIIGTIVIYIIDAVGVWLGWLFVR